MVLRVGKKKSLSFMLGRPLGFARGLRNAAVDSASRSPVGC
jgi:hypothetical protein